MSVAVELRPGEATGTPLLASKLLAPSMPGRVVERPRLFELRDPASSSLSSLARGISPARTGGGRNLLRSRTGPVGGSSEDRAPIALPSPASLPLYNTTKDLSCRSVRLGRSVATRAGHGTRVR